MRRREKAVAASPSHTRAFFFEGWSFSCAEERKSLPPRLLVKVPETPELLQSLVRRQARLRLFSSFPMRGDVERALAGLVAKEHLEEGGETANLGRLFRGAILPFHRIPVEIV